MYLYNFLPKLHFKIQMLSLCILLLPISLQILDHIPNLLLYKDNFPQLLSYQYLGSYILLLSFSFDISFSIQINISIPYNSRESNIHNQNQLHLVYLLLCIFSIKHLTNQLVQVPPLFDRIYSRNHLIIPDLSSLFHKLRISIPNLMVQ